MRIIKLTVLALCLGVSVVWADDRPIYKDKNAPIEDRVEDLLRRMTLREKVGQLQQRCTWDINNIGGTYNGESFGTAHEMNISAQQAADLYQKIHEYMANETRLGIPILTSAEGIHGILQNGCTIFPQAIAQGSTWNPDLICQMTEAEAAEAEAMETPEPELDEYGIAIEDNDQQATPAQDAAEANVSAPAEPRTARVLEVGCGTGCISLSLAWERRGHVTCTATDIEPRAIDLATKNRDALGLTSDEVAFSLTNLVSSIPREEWGTFDVLVSNPPYIPTDVMRSLPHEVKDFEPDLALEGGADGLDIFRRLLNAAPYMLRAGGLFACELYEGALDAAAELCRQAGLSDVRIVHDLTDRPRIVRAIVTEPKQRI
jgi:methylase of polypeptide subunit release factors